ncbi:MAG: hypothetical protein H7330_11520 [Hymenobacteraceae bacterium]|nr:hypothetical protein [Hymenobacteraceae bacterium]
MTRHLVFVVAGLLLVGLGQCLILWADHVKTGGAPVLTWVAAGTGALVVFNTGLCLFGRGIVERVRQERGA